MTATEETMSSLITKKEIDEIKSKAMTIDVLKMVNEKRIIIVKPHWLENGYGISFTIDIMPGLPPINHISVGHRNGTPDPADAEHIAREMLGDYVVLGTMYLKDNIHFESCADMQKLKILIEDFKKLRR
jgi:hypothetical protein